MIPLTEIIRFDRELEKILNRRFCCSVIHTGCQYAQLLVRTMDRSPIASGRLSMKAGRLTWVALRQSQDARHGQIFVRHAWMAPNNCARFTRTRGLHHQVGNTGDLSASGDLLSLPYLNKNISPKRIPGQKKPASELAGRKGSQDGSISRTGGFGFIASMA